MRKKDEFAPASPGSGKTWLLLALLYALFLLWLETLIDLLLGLNPPDKSFEAINAFNQSKTYISNIAFALARCLPILMFLWLGSRVLATTKLPPPELRLPFAVKRVSGPQARMAGIFIMVISLLLLLREITVFVSVPATP